ncbi:MAG: UDP-2,3-diacylglucosamine diphosphatase LpxI, partial [Hyphomicrobium sp.]
MSLAHRAIGILAGGGSLPREIAEYVAARGERVHIVAIAGEVDRDLSPFPVTTVGWGQIGGMVRAFKDAGCSDLVIVGSVRRPDLAALRPDLGFIRSLPAILRIIAAGGDDSVLTRVVRFFEQKGFAVVAPATVAPGLLVGKGPLGCIAADVAQQQDVALGFSIVRALGPYDVGQAVIVSGGRVVAIEGAEGTDAMMARTAYQHRQGRGVLVKRPKPGQELRIDLPAIGPATIVCAAEAGLAGIAVLAGGTLVAERASLIRRADEAGLFVQGFEDALAGKQEDCRPSHSWEPVTIDRLAPRRRQRADIRKGAAVLSALAPLAPIQGAVVAGRYVLAVEAGEGVDSLLERARGLHQWGRRYSARRAGVAVLAQEVDLEPAVANVAAAGLAGLALVGEPCPAVEKAAKEANRLGMFMVVLRALPGGA